MPRTTDGEFLGQHRVRLGNRLAGLLSDDELEHIEKNLQRFYDEERPFYERNNLVRIAVQLEDARQGKGDKVTVDGLDGVPVEFEVKIGDKCEGWGSEKAKQDQEFFIKAAYVQYMTYQMLSRPISKKDATKAYCSMPIQLVVGVRRIIDGKEHITAGEPRAEVEACFNTAQQIWQMSPECTKLKELVSEAAIPENTVKIIGFGLGSLTRHGLSSKLRHRTGVQHAMVLTLRDILGTCRKHSKVPCYVQDPDYNNTDIDILSYTGFTVLGDPMAFLEVDENAVVVSIAPDCPVKEVVVDLARPAVIIWMPAHDAPGLCTDPEGPRVKKFLAESYDKLEFPGQKDYFGLLHVFIRHRDV